MGEALKRIDAEDGQEATLNLGNERRSGNFQPIIRERSRTDEEQEAHEAAMRILSAHSLFSGDNLNRSEKAQILRDLPPGQAGARWRAYVAQARANDAEREGDWLELARSVEEAEEWRRVAEMWKAVQC